MNLRVFIWSFTAAVPGSLFGFDTVVTSEAEKAIQPLWGMSSSVHGIAMASAHWIFAALLTTCFPKMISALPTGYVFSFFAGMMCLQLLWVKTIMPETKNVPLEELQKKLAIG